jgi:hypothetical protein
MRLYTILEYRQAFWGKEPSSEERRLLMADAIRSARHAYMMKASTESLKPTDYPNQLVFIANGIEMCEQI